MCFLVHLRYRRWIQGTFQKAEGSHPASASPLRPLADGVTRQLEACAIDVKKPLPANRPDTAPPDDAACSSSVSEASAREEAPATNGVPGNAVEDGMIRNRTLPLNPDDDASHPQSISSLRNASASGEATGSDSGGDAHGTEEAEPETEAGNGSRLEGGSDAPEDDGGPSLGELFSTPLEYEVTGRAFVGVRTLFLPISLFPNQGRFVLYLVKGPFFKCRRWGYPSFLWK